MHEAVYITQSQYKHCYLEFQAKYKHNVEPLALNSTLFTLFYLYLDNRMYFFFHKQYFIKAIGQNPKTDYIKPSRRKKYLQQKKREYFHSYCNILAKSKSIFRTLKWA